MRTAVESAVQTAIRTATGTEWQAYYLDGRTAARTPVRLRLSEGGLQFTPAGGSAQWWAYDEMRLEPGFHAGDPARLERGGEHPEILLVRDPAFLDALRVFAPGLAAPLRKASRRLGWGAAAVLIVGAILALAITAHLWVIPALASFLAPRVPVSWEARLAGSSEEALAPAESRCDDPARVAPVRDIVARLSAAVPPAGREGRRFRVFVVNEPVVNALAGPGGVIVVYQGLLDSTESPEALAGVLAHEMQHVAQRHVMRLFLEHASSSALIAAATGEGGESLAFGLQNAMMLGLLRYSREHESEADLAGLRLMAAAGIDPRGMIDFLETLREREGEGLPEMLTYLSTHPGMPGRIASLRKRLAEPRAIHPPLLPGLDWKRARAVCGPRPGEGATTGVPRKSVQRQGLGLNPSGSP